MFVRAVFGIHPGGSLKMPWLANPVWQDARSKLGLLNYDYLTMTSEL